jgi:hypothetical protein
MTVGDVPLPPAFGQAEPDYFRAVHYMAGMLLLLGKRDEALDALLGALDRAVR